MASNFMGLSPKGVDEKNNNEAKQNETGSEG